MTIEEQAKHEAAVHIAAARLREATTRASVDIQADEKLAAWQYETAYDAMSANQTKGTGAKLWKELSIEEKIERMRNTVKSEFANFARTIESQRKHLNLLHDAIARLEGHTHNSQGEAVASVRGTSNFNGCDENIGYLMKPAPADPDAVYF